MERKEEFRSVLFGGYHKGEVREYIEALKKELDEARGLYQKESAETIQRLKECEEYKREQEEQISKLQKELAQAKIEAREQARVLEQTREELRRQGEQREKALLDYRMATKVLEDVGRDADLIREEAREEGNKIIAAAVVEAETRKNVIVNRIEAELEEKAIQLDTAKNRIMQYMKEVNDAQQGLHDVYDKMSRMVEGMPLRLEEFWDGEEYRALEEWVKGMEEEEKNIAAPTQ